jgi:hypothetical protein
MSMIDEIKDNVSRNDFKKKNYFKIFSLFAKIFDQVLVDIKITTFNFHPFLCDFKTLKKHRKALFIPQYPLDTEDVLRERVSTAADYLENIGNKGPLVEYLEAVFKNRYSYIELPRGSWRLGFSRLGENTYLFSIRGFRLYIDDLTASEKQMVEAFLDDFLEKDIEFYVFERNNFGSQPGWRLGQGILGVNTYFCHDGGI